eukprot:11793418-Karenia_brevis.AAC.1
MGKTTVTVSSGESVHVGHPSDTDPGANCTSQNCNCPPQSGSYSGQLSAARGFSYDVSKCK